MNRRLFCLKNYGGKRLFRYCTCLFAAFFLLGINCMPARAAMTEDFIRLHVVAASDSECDQAVKLHVRDVCLQYAQETLSGCTDADAAYARLCVDRPVLERVAREAAREMGCTDVRVQIGSFDFPDRVYGDVLVPAGEYRALRVVLGEGEGHNWWCVLYPSLCVLDENVYASGEEVEISFYSSTLRWLKKIFHI